MTILPSEGIAFNTSFEVTIHNCESTTDLEYRAGPILNGKLKAKPFGILNIITFVLPAGRLRVGKNRKIT